MTEPTDAPLSLPSKTCPDCGSAALQTSAIQSYLYCTRCGRGSIWAGLSPVVSEGAPGPAVIALGGGSAFDLEREFYCYTCKDFRDVLQNQGDIVCERCASIIATFRDRELHLRVNPSVMTPEALDQFIRSAAEELEAQLPALRIALDKIEAAKKISGVLLRELVTRSTPEVTND